MERIENIARTYNQAPWRKQLQWIALVALLVVMIAIVAGIYLNISTQATFVGRKIQKMQSEIDDFNRENEDLDTQLAKILSFRNMEARAQTLGFEPVSPDDIQYLRVPGYAERQPVTIAPSVDRNVVAAVYKPPEYTESIFEWVVRNYQDWVRTLAESVP